MKHRHNLSRFTALLLVVIVTGSSLVLSSCEDITKPDPNCSENGTARMTFDNRSSHSSYDVLLDGSRIGTISAGKSISRTVAAGYHTFTFKFHDSDLRACSQAHPNLAACEDATFSCDNDR